MSLYWPLILSLFSGVIYQISSKSSPKAMDPLASLTVTYLLAAAVSGVLYYCVHKDGNLIKEYGNLNWTSFVLAGAVIGIDLGNRYMYRGGWSISNGYILTSVVLSVVLLGVGYFLYKETITWAKLIGVVLCLAGISLITK